jgi:thiol-disulfide isomerase/thioredoxin
LQTHTDRGNGAWAWLPAALLVLICVGTPLPTHAAASLLNHKAPKFARRCLNGSSAGSTVNLRNLRGKVVLLNFWATWCAPCQTEIPAFAAWQRKYGPAGLQVIGISMDDSEEPVRKAIARLRPDYPMVMGDAKLGELYGGVLGLPLTFLIDRNGIVRAQIQGSANLKTMGKRIQELLKR